MPLADAFPSSASPLLPQASADRRLERRRCKETSGALSSLAASCQAEPAVIVLCYLEDTALSVAPFLNHSRTIAQPEPPLGSPFFSPSGPAQ